MSDLEPRSEEEQAKAAAWIAYTRGLLGRTEPAPQPETEGDRDG